MQDKVACKNRAIAGASCGASWWWQLLRDFMPLSYSRMHDICMITATEYWPDANVNSNYDHNIHFGNVGRFSMNGGICNPWDTLCLADVGNICHHNDVRLHFPICSNFFRHFHYFSPWFCHQRASHSFGRLSFTLTTALHLRASARKNMISWLMARFNVTQSYLIVLCLRSRSSSFPRWVLGLTSPKWKHLSLTYS